MFVINFFGHIFEFTTAFDIPT